MYTINKYANKTHINKTNLIYKNCILYGLHYNRQLLNIMFDIEIVTDIQEGIKYMELNNIEFANINFSKIDKYARTIEFLYINITCNLRINNFMMYGPTIFLKPMPFLVE